MSTFIHQLLKSTISTTSSESDDPTGNFAILLAVHRRKEEAKIFEKIEMRFLDERKESIIRQRAQSHGLDSRILRMPPRGTGIHVGRLFNS